MNRVNIDGDVRGFVIQCPEAAFCKWWYTTHLLYVWTFRYLLPSMHSSKSDIDGNTKEVPRGCLVVEIHVSLSLEIMYRTVPVHDSLNLHHILDLFRVPERELANYGKVEV